MSTSNFKPMNYELPLIVGGIGENEEENYWDWEVAEDLVNSYNDNLEYYKVGIISGYYVGFQFYVDENNWFYWDDEENNIKAEEELKYITVWLENLKAEGFTELEVSERFSNGETWYKKVA